ncbi:MAG TPA: glycosyltransferase family 2 protein [Cyclobacteriaceae bacterium]|nr:glycosyltransferase family 2 protein [Cyclobacteriaceae bacterium]
MATNNSTSEEYPLLSIGVPTYNGAKRIHKALNSIWNSGYPNLEVIICDNCSTDNTQDICEQVAREHPEVRYIRHKENLGILRNFEFALEQAKGQYFMWVADDDIVEPGVLTRYVDFLEANREYSLVSGKIRYWVGDVFSHFEQKTIEHVSPARRFVEYYLWVRWGGLFHGLMRCDLAQKVPTRKVYGNDWHFVATMAYLGKIKTFDYIGYNKHLGGSSGHWARYAKSLGEPFWVGKFPMVKIALDAFRELYRSPVFDDMPGLKKFSTGVLAFMAVMYKHLPQEWRHNIKKEEYYKPPRPKTEIINLREAEH